MYSIFDMIKVGNILENINLQYFDMLKVGNILEYINVKYFSHYFLKLEIFWDIYGCFATKYNRMCTK